MIRLHSPFERIVMVSPERITHVKPDHERPERTRIYFGDDYITVRESVEEVARKVLEWRLLISKYDSLRNAIAQEWGKGSQEQLICEVELVKISLYKLAGLEEPNHDT